MSCMPTIDHLRALGSEIDRLRVARGIRSVRALATAAGVSNQHLGQVINAYQHPKRGFTIPSDDMLERLAEVLSVPVSRFHALLGRFPDVPFPAFNHAEAVELAETYDRLSEYGRKIVQDTVRSVSEAEGRYLVDKPQT